MSFDNEDDPMDMDEASADKRNQIQVSLTPSTSRLFRVYRTISSMLNKRGYMIPREYLNMTPVTFVGKFGMDPPREGLTMLVEKSDDESDQLFVFFPDEEKVGVKPIRILVERMKAEGVVSAIMVLRQGVTSLAKQAVLEVSDSFSIEHFREAELLVDITEHTLVRKTMFCSRFFYSFCNLPIT